VLIRGGEERQQCRKRDAGKQRKAEPGVNAVIGHADPAFEADGEKQVDRKPLGHGLGYRKVGPGERGGQPKSERKHNRRDDVGGREGKDFWHGGIVSVMVSDGAEVFVFGAVMLNLTFADIEPDTVQSKPAGFDLGGDEGEGHQVPE